MTWFTSGSHIATVLDRTVDGEKECWSWKLPKQRILASSHGLKLPVSWKTRSAPVAIWADVYSAALAGSYQDSMKATLRSILGLTALAPSKKALISSLTSSAWNVPTAPSLFDLVILPAMVPSR